MDELRDARQASRRALTFALGLTTVFLVAEVVGGILSNSLALLADAGHMLSDVQALVFALFAVWVASRPPTSQHTFGYQRVEVLAAGANGVGLLLVAGYVFWQAAERFTEPPEVQTGLMLTVGFVGLAANIGSALILYPQEGKSLNVRGAFYHVLGDLLGSVGVIVAALVMLPTGWFIVDPLISVFIGILIIVAAWRLIRESLVVLLEATPRHIDAHEVEQALLATEGVVGLHDLHIWTVTSGLVALSCHCELSGDRPSDQVLAELCDMLHERFGIHHVTIQPEVQRLHGSGGAHALPRCTSVIGHGHRPAQAPSQR